MSENLPVEAALGAGSGADSAPVITPKQTAAESTVDAPEESSVEITPAPDEQTVLSDDLSAVLQAAYTEFKGCTTPEDTILARDKVLAARQMIATRKDADHPENANNQLHNQGGRKRVTMSQELKSLGTVGAEVERERLRLEQEKQLKIEAQKAKAAAELAAIEKKEEKENAKKAADAAAQVSSCVKFLVERTS